MDNNHFVRVDEWTPKDNDHSVMHDGKLIIIPFDKIFNRDIQAINTFVIKKDSYVRKLGIDGDDKGICHYINYFIANYDLDKELLVSYLKLKYIIDNKERPIKTKAFIKLLYSILFTPSLRQKIIDMVEDNYYIDIRSKDGNKYVETLEFTNEHAKIMMQISISMKIMVPVMFHYINTYNLLKEVPLFDFYEKLFDIYGKDVDIYIKLWATTTSRVKQSYKNNKVIWQQREIMGVDPHTYGDQLLKKNIIVETMFKYAFNKNIISFNSVVIDKQLNFFIIEQYTHTPIELKNEKDSEGLSGIDKLEMNSYKIDESLIILSDVNIKETIKKLRKSMNVNLPKEEIQFYKDNYKINKFQVQLVYYYYAKYFGGYRDLNLLTREQYLRLLVLLKRKLQFQGLVYLPQIITGNVDKLNKRVIQNAKFLSKIENSTIYQSLVNEKFSTLEELNKSNMILGLLSTIINTKFTIVDYDNPDKIGESLEILNPDILSDEFLHFLNQL
jgi:hypothetical protein